MFGSIKFLSLLCVLGAMLTSDVVAQRLTKLPDQVSNVGVDEHLNDRLPMNTFFRDEQGMPRPLGEYFPENRPVILSMNYSNCPKLCNVQLTGLVTALREIDLKPGKDFEIVSVSIDPKESSLRASQTRDKYVNMYSRKATTEGWHFLTGDEKSIQLLAKTVGFRYQKDAVTGHYNHAAVFMICTPDGRLSRYFYNVEFPSQTLHLSLVEASEGKIGSTFDQVILYCFSYDPDSNSYALVAINVMKLGGLTTILILACLLIPYWVRKPREKKASSNLEPAADSKPSKPTPGSECWHI